MNFFDKMKKQMGPAFNDASQKLKEGAGQMAHAAQEKLQENKLKSQLKTLLSEKAEKLHALGAKVFDLHRGDGIGINDLTVELSHLDALEALIAAKQVEIEAHNAVSPTSEPDGTAVHPDEYPADSPDEGSSA